MEPATQVSQDLSGDAGPLLFPGASLGPATPGTGALSTKEVGWQKPVYPQSPLPVGATQTATYHGETHRHPGEKGRGRTKKERQRLRQRTQTHSTQKGAEVCLV